MLTDSKESSIIITDSNESVKPKLKEGEQLKADRRKLETAMARACMNTEDLQKASGMPRPSINNVIAGKNIRPGTIGRIAKALNVDVTEILED